MMNGGCDRSVDDASGRGDDVDRRGMRAVVGAGLYGCDASGCESDVAWLDVLGTASRNSQVRAIT